MTEYLWAWMTVEQIRIIYIAFFIATIVLVIHLHSKSSFKLSTPKMLLMISYLILGMTLLLYVENIEFDSKSVMASTKAIAHQVMTENKGM